MIHSENNLVESKKFWLVHRRIYLLYGQTKCLVDPTKYFIDSTKLFGSVNQFGIFGILNQKMYFNQPKFVGFNQIFMDIQQNSFVGPRKIFFGGY